MEGFLMRPRLGSSDIHFVFNARTHLLKCFDSAGRCHWMIEAHGEGTNGPGYDVVGGDTPPGLYRCSPPEAIPSDDAEAGAYGPYFVNLLEMEKQESSRGRAGVGVHGGGSGLPNPYFSKHQGWVYTHGCIRLQNEDL